MVLGESRVCCYYGCVIGLPELAVVIKDLAPKPCAPASIRLDEGDSDV